MKISVITACFNNASALESTIASFREQSHDDKELIIIDGGSTDSSVQVIKAAGDTVHKWISEPDQGVYDALNKGIKLSEGDAIGFLHAGDYFAESDVLKKINNAFLQNDADGVYGDLRYIKKNKDKIIRHWKSGPFYAGHIRNGWMPPHPTFYLKREVYDLKGLFDLSFKIASDYDLMLRVLKDPLLKIAYIPEVLIDMETGGLSNGRLVNIIRKSAEDYRAMKKNNIPHPFWVLCRKNLRKIRQFF